MVGGGQLVFVLLFYEIAFAQDMLLLAREPQSALQLLAGLK
jgi:hypothetical protein